MEAIALPKPTTIAACGAHARRVSTMTTATAMDNASVAPPIMTNVVAADMPRRT